MIASLPGFKRSSSSEHCSAAKSLALLAAWHRHLKRSRAVTACFNRTLALTVAKHRCRAEFGCEAAAAAGSCCEPVAVGEEWAAPPLACPAPPPAGPTEAAAAALSSARGT